MAGMAATAARSRCRGIALLAALGFAAVWLNGPAPTFLPGAVGRDRSQGSQVSSPRRQWAQAALAAAALVAAWPDGARAAEQNAGWLETKAKESGVVSLPSGLMYKVLEEGPAGGPSPKASTPCECTYAGQLVSGKQFDAGTLTFAPNQVIKGWTEAMQLMKQGDKWELYIPSKLGYGDRGAGGAIPPGASLVFQMKINKVQ